MRHLVLRFPILVLLFGCSTLTSCSSDVLAPDKPQGPTPLGSWRLHTIDGAQDTHATNYTITSNHLVVHRDTSSAIFVYLPSESDNAFGLNLDYDPSKIEGLPEIPGGSCIWSVSHDTLTLETNSHILILIRINLLRDASFSWQNQDWLVDRIENPDGSLVDNWCYPGLSITKGVWPFQETVTFQPPQPEFHCSTEDYGTSINFAWYTVTEHHNWYGAPSWDIVWMSTVDQMQFVESLDDHSARYWMGHQGTGSYPMLHFTASATQLIVYVDNPGQYLDTYVLRCHLKT